MASEVQIIISARDIATQTLKNVTSSLQATTKQMDQLASSARKLGSDLTKVFGGIGLLGGYAIKAASDAAESEALFAQSMGNMAEEARKWSETLREQMGLNEYAVRRQVATFNLMFESMGLGEQAAFDMSRALTQLAYDMSSLYNIRIDEALQKLQAGITGEVEPLKRLGIVINETTVQAYALRTGMIKQGETLSEQGKILARFNLIMEATRAAQGNWVREMENPATQMKILQEQTSQLAIELGNALLPLWKDALELAKQGLERLKELVAWFIALSDSSKRNIAMFAALLAASGPLTLAFSGLTKGISLAVAGISALIAFGSKVAFAFSAWSVGAATATEALGFLAGAFGPFLVGGAIIAGLVAITTYIARIRDEAKIAATEINQISDLATAKEKERLLRKRQQELEADIRNLMERQREISALPADYRQYAGAPTAGMQLEMVNEMLERNRRELSSVNRELAELDKKTAELNGTVNVGTDVATEFREIWAAIQEELKKAGSGAQTTGDAVKTVLQTLEANLTKAVGLEAAFGDAFDLNQAKAQSYRQAIEDLISLGLSPQSEAVAKLIERYQALNAEISKASINSIIAEMNQQLAQAAEKERLLGDAFNLNAEKARIFSSAIDRLIAAGVTAGDPLLRSLYEKLQIVSAPMPVNEIREIETRASEELLTLLAQSVAMSAEEFLERAEQIVQETLEELVAKGASPEVRDRWARALMQIGARLQMPEVPAEWQELKRLQADQRAFEAESKATIEMLANLAAAEEERLFKQIHADARAFEAESRAIAEEIANLAAAEEERLFKQMIADARAFDVESRALAEQEANLKAYEQEQLLRAAIEGARAIEAEGREYEAWKAREQARQLQQYGADQRAIQAEGRAYEEERARMIENTLREWEQGVLRIEGLQTQAVRRMLAEDNRAYEQWRAQLQEQILMAQVSVGRALTNRLDVEAQIAIRLGEPAETLQAEASAIESAINTIVTAMLSLGASTEEILTNIDPLISRLKEIKAEMQAMQAEANMLTSLQRGLSEGLKNAGGAWGEFMAMVVSSIEVAVDSVRGITLDLKQSLYNLASQGFNLLGQALVDLFTLPARMRREYRYGSYGQVNYPDLAQMVENYQNWDENYQALLNAQQAQTGMTVGGGLIGALIGFLVGGPLGALVGAGIGAGAGYLAGQAAYGDTIEDLRQKLQDTFQKIAETLQTAIGNVADALGNAFSADTYQGFLAEFAQDLESVVKGGLIRAFMAGEVMRPLLQSLSDFITAAVWDGVLSAEEKLGLQEHFQEIVAVAGPFWEALSEFDFAEALGVATEAVNEFAEALRNVPTGFKVETYRWQAAAAVPMASGGIVTRPTLALVGEAGREAVVPLDRGDFGRAPIHVHIHGDVYGFDDFERKVETAINRVSTRKGLSRYGLALGGVHV